MLCIFEVNFHAKRRLATRAYKQNVISLNAGYSNVYIVCLISVNTFHRDLALQRRAFEGNYTQPKDIIL